MGVASRRKEAGVQQHMWAKVRGQRNNSVGIRETEWAAKNEAKEQSGNQMCLKGGDDLL